MKLERKLLSGYLVIIVIAIMTSFTLFTFSSNQFLTYRIVEEMKSELQFLTSDLKKNEYATWPLGNVIQQDLMRLVQSNLIIIRDSKIVYYDHEEVLNDVIEAENDTKHMDKKYITVAGTIYNGPTRYDIILLSEKSMINELNQINLSILFIASLIGMLIASFLGIYVQNNISSPIHELKNKVRQFKGTMTAPHRTIFTNDELQELDEGFVEMAESIANNDRQRKAFFENTSHELKTPLMNIRGYTEGLKDGIFTVDEASDVIYKESEVLTAMVEAILYLSKLEDATQDRFLFEAINLNEFLQGFSYRMNGLVMEKGLTLNLDLDQSVTVNLDEDKVIRALSNIVSNAVRYAKSEITIQTNVTSGKVEINFLNDGPKIKEKDLPHLFDRFYKGDKGQSGLGLAIVRSIVVAHGGTVEAFNTETGVNMRVVLPYIAEIVETPSRKSPILPKPKTPKQQKATSKKLNVPIIEAELDDDFNDAE